MLQKLYLELANALDGDLEIERFGRAALVNASAEASKIRIADPVALEQSFVAAMSSPDAHPACGLIMDAALDWAPPTTSSDPNYVAHSTGKAHVELVGPDGLVKSDTVRLGLYGILPGNEYGVRTHLAEEVFVMLAGEADWKRGEEAYIAHRAPERSHHPSMMAHATRTRDQAFMSIYIWRGDVSTKSYVYHGRI